MSGELLKIQELQIEATSKSSIVHYLVVIALPSEGSPIALGIGSNCKSIQHTFDTILEAFKLILNLHDS